jgi:hypothetical protein
MCCECHYDVGVRALRRLQYRLLACAALNVCGDEHVGMFGVGAWSLSGSGGVYPGFGPRNQILWKEKVGRVLGGFSFCLEFSTGLRAGREMRWLSGIE